MDHRSQGQDPLVGRRIADRFVIRTLLARGAMGRVYEAEQVPLGRRVAVKFLDIRGSGEDTSDWVERFRREAASLAALTSPHTVRIIDYGWWEGRTYLVMEFIDGISLARVLRDGPLEIPRAIDIALQICDSLQEAHARGLIHRDLKPDNVLLTRVADGREWAKLVDWGLVKQVDPEHESTTTGMLLGTPSYMAPELIRGEPIDGRTDLYALGVVLFRMLTGKKPFDARTTTAGVLLTHLQEPPSRLGDAAPHRDFPEILDAVVARALMKRAADRYPTAAEMARDLEVAYRLVNGEHSQSSELRDISGVRRSVSSSLSSSYSIHTTPVKRRARWSVGAAIAVVLAFGATAAGLGLVAAVLSGSPEIERIEVEGSIRGNTTWTADRIWVLAEPVFVEEGSLTIEPGTRIEGREGAALVVTTDATLRARGRADAPIVFTSARPAGERAPGDWGGVVLLGDAPVNSGQGTIEGIPEGDPRGRYGGDDPAVSCGVLEYVRIEFSGYEVYANNELNGLTLGGCGSDTIVRDVQIHRSLDDGIELFGGSADLFEVLVTLPGDDGLDWDEGWTGRIQFLIVQMGADSGDNAIEADSNARAPDTSPRSAPTLSHVTLVGSPNPTVAQRAITFRAGTAGTIRNFVARGFNRELVDIRDPATAAVARRGELTLGPGVVYEVGPGHQPFPVESGEEDDDASLDEEAWVTDVVQADPMLLDDVFDPTEPRFAPLSDSPARQGAARLPDDEFWEQAATWQGALMPGVSSSWLDGWTAHPGS